MSEKRMGRPAKQPVEGERVALGLRVSAGIKARLLAAAQQSKRSLSQEAEMRIEHSFRDERIEKILEDILRRLP